MRGIKILVLIGLIVAVLVSFSFASAQVENDTKEKVVKTPPPEKKDCPSEETCELWGEFKEKYPSNYSWQVKWHGGRDSPHWINGFYTLGSEIKDKSDAEAIAIDIITDSKDLLKINDVSDLKLRRTMEDKWTFIPEYDQYYKGIPVYGGEVRVILNKNNVFSGLTNTFYPGIDISITPKITRAKAVDVVLKQEGADLSVTEIPLAISKTILSIVPKSENRNITYHLTWRVPTHTAIYFISTEDGSIVLRVQTASPATGKGGSIGGVSYGTFALALLKKLWIPVALFMLISFVVWRWRR